MSDAASAHQTLVELRAQLEQSRQQQERLKEALTRVLSLIDDFERP